MKKNLPHILILLVIYLLALGIRIYWLSHKNGFHVDEGMALTLSSYKEYTMGKNYDINREYTGKEVKDNTLVSNTNLKEALDDIKKLWKDNRDAPHTNLYYTLLRIFLTGQKTSDIKQIIFRGGTLNLLLFTLSFIFFFLLIKNLFPGLALLQYSALLCAFLSTATISNTLFFRPYQIQETMFIVFCYYFIKTLDYKKYIIDNDKRYISKSLVPFSLITAITLLTGYYAILFIVLFGLYVIYIQCKEKKYAEIKFYLLVLCLGVLFAQAFYLKFLDGFGSYRATETTRTIFGNAGENLKNSVIAAGTLIHKHFFTYPVITVCVLCLLYLLLRRQKLFVQKHSLYIFIAAAVYFLVTLIIAPYKILRYGMPVYPFFVILPLIIINSTIEKAQKISFAAVILLTLSFLPGAVSENKLENLFRHKPDEYIFAREKNVPVYVYMHYYAKWNYIDLWKYANLIPYLNDEQKYYFITNYQDLYDVPYDEFYLVMEKFWGLEESGYLNDHKFEVLEEMKITGGEPETAGGLGYYYICRKLKPAN
jgi:hypothetical protein